MIKGKLITEKIGEDSVSRIIIPIQLTLSKKFICNDLVCSGVRKIYGKQTPLLYPSKIRRFKDYLSGKEILNNIIVPGDDFCFKYSDFYENPKMRRDDIINIDGHILVSNYSIELEQMDLKRYFICGQLEIGRFSKFFIGSNIINIKEIKLDDDILFEREGTSLFCGYGFILSYRREVYKFIEYE